MPPTTPPRPEHQPPTADRLTDQPFVDPHQVPGLYADRKRVKRRSDALLKAKIQGLHVGETAAALLGWTVPAPGLRPDGRPAVIADIGCGQGRPTRTLIRRLPLAHVLAIDASTVMLTQARALLSTPAANPAPPPAQQSGSPVALLAADFHRLPLDDGSLDAATAVFCLYHSVHPWQVIGEIARTLTTHGTEVLISKFADSYRELDLLLADSDLDPHAPDRPSLYGSASGEALADLAASALSVQTVLHDRHVFQFRNIAHVTEYLLTVPKYRLPADLLGDSAAIAARLRQHHGDGPFQTTSTITYVLARRPA